MICFDANLLLEVIFGRKYSNLVVDYLENTQESIVISALTGHLVVYFGKKERKISVLQEFLRDFKVLSLESADFEWAFNNMMNDDFEDSLQLAVAVRNGCEQFVTLDRKLYLRYKNLNSLKVKLLR